MNHSETLNELAAALAKAQGAFQNPKKNREVKVTSKRTGAQYKFSYATFDEIVDCVRKPLADNGLAFTQGVNGAAITTMLLHASGQWLSTELPIKIGDADNAAQAMGSAITYAKRYAITAMLGIASEEDDDANAADGNVIDQSRYRESPPPQHSAKRNGNGGAHTPGNIDTGTRASAAETYVEQSIAKLKAMKTNEEMATWWKAAAKHIGKLEENHPALHDRLVTAYEAAFERGAP